MKSGYSLFAAVFWFKIISLGIIFYFINSYKSKEYYYYQNLGVSKVMLWGTTLTFDFTLFLFIIYHTHLLK
ncbi:hypothetical protein C1N53_03585 [Pontibacter sp. SGAir0037]|nr:hypothetical protein C1N53_03585 [Pontibacter sp. SGAir0037]